MGSGFGYEDDRTRKDSTLSALYVFYLLAALLWNAAAAAAHRKDPTIPRARRGLAIVAFALAVLGLSWMGATSAFTTNPFLYGVSAALPLACFAAAWQVAATARERGPWSWLVVLYDAVLGVALAARWVAYLGAPIGAAGEGLSLSLVGLQYFAFAPALWFPAFVPVPIVARPASAETGVPRVAWRVWIGFAGLTVALVLWGWAPSTKVIAGWRAHRVVEVDVTRGHPPLRSSRVLETLFRDRDERFFDRDLRLARELGLDAVTVVLSTDGLMAPGELLPKLDRFVARNRAEGRKLVLWLQPPSAWYRAGMGSRAEAARVLGAAQRATAARFHPDVQIVVGDPVLAQELIGPGAGRADSARWAIAALAESVRAGSPSTLVAAYGLEESPLGPDSSAAARREVFRWAAADSSPVDRVGFALHPGFGDTALFARRLAGARALLEDLGPSKRAWVFECGASPVTFGERAQRRHLEWVLAWAAADPRLEGVSQTALGDYAEVVGLVSALGRRREAFEAYRKR